MLNPNERKLYLEALKPPAGYALDRGIATTFSLDLLTLLIVPLSFVLFDYEGEEDLKDQTKVMEALQRTSERLTIYCQRGRISVPKVNSLLYSYLEKCVVEVNADGTFHPKTWLLRFTSESEPAQYRFICLSRNLTFDKSWDTLLVVDGEVNNTIQPESKPLLDYLLSLPVMAGRVDSDIEDLIEELSRVKFMAPPGFDRRLKFQPLGIDGYNANLLFGKAERMLVVSPFVSDKLLRQIAVKTGARCTLLSRMDSLDALDEETLRRFEKLYVIDEPDAEDTAEDEQTDQEYNRSDLHAKLFVLEQGSKTKIITGSANATNSAFSINTEFMVEMIADRKVFDIDRMLLPENNPFGTVIREYRPQEKVDVDSEKVELEAKVDDLRRKIAGCDFELTVDASETKGAYDLKLMTADDKLALEEGTAVHCWPITLKDDRAKNMDCLREGDLIFAEMSPAGVTSFIAFEVTVRGRNQKTTSRFVLNLPITGIPEDRDEKILISIISDRSRFLRYLLFLLAEGQSYQPALADLIPGSGGVTNHPDRSSAEYGLPLMEELVRALSRSPEKIDRIARLVQELVKSDEGREILPDDFNLVWEAIWEVRRGMVKSK